MEDVYLFSCHQQHYGKDLRMNLFEEGRSDENESTKDLLQMSINEYPLNVVFGRDINE